MSKLVDDRNLKSQYRKVKINGISKDEHRYNMEQAIGRPLTFDEVVHHKNGNKLDNRLENLEVMSRLEHSRLHLQKHDYSKICSVCGKEFTPKPTHRQRAKVCSEKCKRINDSKNHSVPVEQLSHSGEVIRVWNSATEAAKALGGERTSIVVCLKGRGKTALGYKWRYRNG